MQCEQHLLLLPRSSRELHAVVICDQWYADHQKPAALTAHHHHHHQRGLVLLHPAAAACLVPPQRLLLPLLPWRLLLQPGSALWARLPLTAATLFLLGALRCHLCGHACEHAPPVMWHANNMCCMAQRLGQSQHLIANTLLSTAYGMRLDYDTV
jgi:hypothetical protein